LKITLLDFSKLPLKALAIINLSIIIEKEIANFEFFAIQCKYAKLEFLCEFDPMMFGGEVIHI